MVTCVQDRAMVACYFCYVCFCFFKVLAKRSKLIFLTENQSKVCYKHLGVFKSFILRYPLTKCLWLKPPQFYNFVLYWIRCLNWSSGFVGPSKRSFFKVSGSIVAPFLPPFSKPRGSRNVRQQQNSEKDGIEKWNRKKFKKIEFRTFGSKFSIKILPLLSKISFGLAEIFFTQLRFFLVGEETRPEWKFSWRPFSLSRLSLSLLCLSSLSLSLSLLSPYYSPFLSFSFPLLIPPLSLTFLPPLSFTCSLSLSLLSTVGLVTRTSKPIECPETVSVLSNSNMNNLDKFF